MSEYRITFNYISVLIFISGLSLLILPARFFMNFNNFIFIFIFLFFILFLSHIFKFYLIKIGIKLLIILCCLLFFFHSYALSYLNQAQKISTYSSPINLKVEIIKILKQQDYQRVIAKSEFLSPLSFPYNFFSSSREQYLYLNWPIKDVVKVGQKWQVNVKLKPISSRLNIGGFDRQKWFYSHKIIADGKVKKAKLMSEKFSWRQQKLNLAREQTQTLSMGGLLIALSFGERAWLSPEIWHVYQQSNTSHLIAISGLHIGLAMLMGFAFIRLLQGILPTKWIGPNLPLFGGLCFAFFYAWLAGFNIPTLRAFFAVFVVILIKLGRYHCNNWQLLLWIVAILLILEPLAMLSNSFWLSFSAVLSLLVWYQFVPLSLFLYRGQSLAQGKWRYLWGIIHLQIGLFWLFTPIQLLIFNGFSLLGFEANLIAVPFFSFILVPCVLWATITNGSFYSWQLANSLANWIHHKLIPFSLQWEYISLTQSYLFSFILLLSFFFFILFLQRKGKRELTKSKLNQGIENRLNFKKLQKLWGFSEYYPLQTFKIRNFILMMVFLLFIYALAYVNTLFKQPLWRLSMLDVGQGLAILIVKNDKAILYDTGVGWRGGSMAQLEIIPYLERQGLQLEKIILSHDDNDHAGGMSDLLRHYPTTELIQSSYKNYQFKDIQPKTTYCLRGRNWQWQGLNFQVLSPNKLVNRAKNEDSCVLLINDGAHKILLMGDAGRIIENKIKQNIGEIDVLQVGHHGSRTASSLSFLRKIKPKIALISVGRWNPWGLPDKKVLANFKYLHSHIYSSRLVGQTMLEFYSNNIQIRVGRGNYSPWYRALVGEKKKSEYNKPFFYL